MSDLELPPDYFAKVPDLDREIDPKDVVEGDDVDNPNGGYFCGFSKE